MNKKNITDLLLEWSIDESRYSGKFPGGWISPEGKHYSLQSKDGTEIEHYKLAETLCKTNHKDEYDPKEHSAGDFLRKKGWTSYGHADEPSASGNNLHEPNHPATRIVRDVLQKHPHIEQFELHNPKTEQYHKVHAGIYAKYGGMRHPITGQRIDFHGKGKMAWEA